MKTVPALIACVALAALLAPASTRAQSAIPDEGPGAGAITGPSMGSNPEVPSDAGSGTETHRPAGDAPAGQTGPTKDDPGTGTGNQPRSNDWRDAGDTPLDSAPLDAHDPVGTGGSD